MVGVGIVIGIALVCGGVILWDKWKKDCVKAGVCKFDGQENGKMENENESD